MDWKIVRLWILRIAKHEKIASGIEVDLIFQPDKDYALRYNDADVRKELRRFILEQAQTVTNFSKEEIENLRMSLQNLPENLVGEISGTITVTTHFDV
jgi:hypothetical protein